MDKELPELPSSGHPVHIRLTPSTPPGGDNILTTSAILRKTINIEQLAANLKESGFELRKETPVMAYTAMNNEIYKALNIARRASRSVTRKRTSAILSFPTMSTRTRRICSVSVACLSMPVIGN